jgi:excisionase family DNA binding protein
MCRPKLHFASERGADEADSFAARKIAARKTTQSEKVKLGDRGKKQMRTLTYTMSKAAAAAFFGPRLRSSAFLDASSVAEFLGVSRRWVMARTRAGELPALRFGKVFRYKLSAVEAWLEEQDAKR